jgi:tetratricopeptide (TPR) repeat protein
VKRLDTTALRCLQAAQGWLGLGLPADALAELDGIPPGQQRHPAVLETRWMICAEQMNWDVAVTVAEDLIAQAPDDANGWLHRAYALRRSNKGGLAEARQALSPAVEKFPDEPVIPYNLSCYACQLQQLAEARIWLQRALKVGKKAEIKGMALADADLEPLWDEIRKL